MLDELAVFAALLAGGDDEKSVSCDPALLTVSLPSATLFDRQSSKFGLSPRRSRGYSEHMYLIFEI
jgi:hypothetical protein